MTPSKIRTLMELMSIPFRPVSQPIYLSSRTPSKTNDAAPTDGLSNDNETEMAGHTLTHSLVRAA